MRYTCSVLCMFIVLCIACTSRLEESLSFAGKNRGELEKVLKHFNQLPEETLKRQAAEFLIENMVGKYSHEGEILEHYDHIFHLSDSLRKKKEDNRKQQQIEELFKQLNKKYGDIRLSKLQRKFDSQTLSADFLIQNINQSFLDWQQSVWHKETNFQLFCEYILPYRVANEKVEVYKEKYNQIFCHIKDSISDPKEMMLAINTYLRRKMLLKTDRIFWQYSPDISISQMERGRRGSCRHIATYTALIMKTVGLPVSVDYAVWGNRSGGHQWNVLVENSGIFPVNVLENKQMQLTYKPAKIFRKNYRNNNWENLKINMEEIPPEFIINQDLDVTSQYVKSHTISVPIIFPWTEKKRNHGVICIFDNKQWAPVFLGKIKKNKMIFTDMASDIVYLYGFYDNGKVIPAGHPFLLKKDGNVQFFKANGDYINKVILERKYPLLRNVQDMAWGLKHSIAEGSNNVDFKQSTLFFQLGDSIESKVVDSLVHDPAAYRYVRWNLGYEYSGNLAEVEFYGKKKDNEQEEKLVGKMLYKVEKEDNPHYNAMDNNLETYFSKAKNSEGWIGLDFGTDNESIVTKIRFCPRSDTNFIMPGNIYELCYWNKNEWVCLGSKKATESCIVYDQVPKGTLLILHNLSQGKEERIFTYENGKQVWW